MFVYLGAFVELHTEKLLSISCAGRLRIFCAGVWHNLTLAIISLMIMMNFSSSSLSCWVNSPRHLTVSSQLFFRRFIALDPVLLCSLWHHGLYFSRASAQARSSSPSVNAILLFVSKPRFDGILDSSCPIRDIPSWYNCISEQKVSLCPEFHYFLKVVQKLFETKKSGFCINEQIFLYRSTATRVWETEEVCFTKIFGGISLCSIYTGDDGVLWSRRARFWSFQEWFLIISCFNHNQHLYFRLCFSKELTQSWDLRNHACLAARMVRVDFLYFRRSLHRFSGSRSIEGSMCRILRLWKFKHHLHAFHRDKHAWFLMSLEFRFSSILLL